MGKTFTQQRFFPPKDLVYYWLKQDTIQKLRLFLLKTLFPPKKTSSCICYLAFWKRKILSFTSTLSLAPLKAQNFPVKRLGGCSRFFATSWRDPISVPKLVPRALTVQGILFQHFFSFLAAGTLYFLSADLNLKEKQIKTLFETFTTVHWLSNKNPLTMKALPKIGQNF